MLYLGRETKAGVVVFWLFFKMDISSAISFKRSRRELSTDMAEYRSMLKSFRNTHYPRFSFLTQNRYSIPKTGFVITVKG